MGEVEQRLRCGNCGSRRVRVGPASGSDQERGVGNRSIVGERETAVLDPVAGGTKQLKVG